MVCNQGLSYLVHKLDLIAWHVTEVRFLAHKQSFVYMVHDQGLSCLMHNQDLNCFVHSQNFESFGM